MNNFSSYGENSGFSAVPAGELELVNGGKTVEVRTATGPDGQQHPGLIISKGGDD